VLVLWGIDRQFSSSGEFSSLFVEHTGFGRNMRVFFLVIVAIILDFSMDEGSESQLRKVIC
jgi:hypothetical protein